MNHLDFRRIDLNLLVTFDALMTSGNVTRAAEKLRLGQPAVSHRLARLRALLRDALFVPTPRGLVPTARARQLAERARPLLEEARDMLLPGASFEPATWSGSFRIGLPDTLEMILVPPLTAELHATAPGVRLTLLAASDWRQAVDAVEHGGLDLYVGFAADLKPWHRSVKLWDEGFLALFSPRLKLKTPLSLKDFLRHRHIMATPREGSIDGRTDRVLAKLNKKRAVAISTPHFLAVPHMLPAAPLIAVMHARPAKQLASTHGLIASPLPFDMGTFPEMLVWHASNDAEPPQSWLRNTIATLAKRVTANGARSLAFSKST